MTIIIFNLKGRVGLKSDNIDSRIPKMSRSSVE